MWNEEPIFTPKVGTQNEQYETHKYRQRYEEDIMGKQNEELELMQAAQL